MTSLANPLLLALVLFSGAPLLAQPVRPERPYRGLFDGGAGAGGPSGDPHEVTLRATVGGGYTSDVLGEAAGEETRPPGARHGSTFAHVAAGIDYSMSLERIQLGLSAASSGRYFPDSGSGLDFAHRGSASVSLQLTRTTRLSGSEQVLYQPYSALSFFPQLFEPQFGEAAVLDPDFDTGMTHYVAYETSVGLSQQISRRASLGFGYSRHRSDFPTGPTYVEQGGYGGFRLNLARGLDLHLGYGYSEGGEAGVPSKVGSHNIDAGIDFSRAWSLSLSRQTTLSFSTGSSLTVDDASRTRYWLTGSARLNHEIGRSWNAAIAYGRDVEFSQALREPVFRDGATAGIGGLVTRRLEFQAAAAAGFGAVGLDGRSDDLIGYSGTASLLTALNRHVGLGVRYVYLRSSLHDRVTPPADFPRDVDRHTVLGYVSLCCGVRR